MNINEIKEEIRDIFREILCREIPEDNDISFLEIGGGSFEFSKLQVKIKKKYGQKIPLKVLFRNNSVNSIAEILCECVDNKANEEKICPQSESVSITDMQKVVYVGRNDHVTLGGCASKTYFELSCDSYDRKRFFEAAKKIIDRHAFTRMAYSEDNTCRVVNDYDFDIPEYDLRGLEDEERQMRLEEIRKRQFAHEFDPSKPPLIAFCVSVLDKGKAVIHCSYDGLVSDGEGLEILIQELDSVYKGEELPTPCEFKDYCKYLQSLKTSAEYKEDEKYWREMVNNVSHRPKLPMRVRPEQVDKPISKQIVRWFTNEEYTALGKIARAEGVTLFVLLLTMFGKTLRLYSKNASFFINVPMSVRPPECRNIEKTIGLCSNFTFVHFDDSRDLSISETAVQTQDTLLDCQEHSSYIGTDILKIFRERIGASIPAPITFTSTVDSDRSSDLNNFRKEYIRTYTSQNWIEVLLAKCAGKVAFIMNYESNILPEYVAQGIADCFMENTVRLASEPEIVNSLSGLSVCKKDMKIISENAFNDSGREPSFVSIAEKLIRSLDTESEKTAIACENGTLSYKELKDMAQSFLSAIKKTNNGSLPARVAIYMNKSPEQIVAAVSCICGGISYMPFESEMPTASVLACMKNADIDTLIVSKELTDDLKESGVSLLIAEKELFHTEKSEELFIDPASISSDDEIVIINTSGSTGIPKSVSISQKGLSHCFINTPHLYGLPEKPVGLAVTSFGHDLALYDTLGLLMLGGTVVVPTDEKRKEPSHWAVLMEKYKVSVWNSVPTFIEMFTLLDKETCKRAGRYLKAVILGGDWVRPALVSEIRSLCPDTEVISIGGPTETTVWNIFHEVEQKELSSDYIPYGKPFPNTSYFILNDNMKLCPVGVTGTMYVSGISLSRGYIGNDEENARRFTSYCGRRVYNTGDKGKYLPDGNIRIMGRDDFQVKINGKRIELVGIENAIKLYDPILTCTVIVNDKTNKILAFYTSEIEVDEQKLRASLGKSLQDYMIPSEFVRLDEMPLTFNGKIDRKKLKQMIPQILQHEKTEEIFTQGSETALKLLEACRDIIEDDDISIEDDFYSMGGDSIAAMKISAWVRQHYSVELTVVDVLNNPTIKDWAAVINRKVSAGRTLEENV